MKQLDLFSAPPFADEAGQASRAFPFRTVLHHAPPEAIDAANEMYAGKGIMRIEPVDEALRRIANAKAPSRSRLLSWALHPDERVRLALIRSPLVEPNRLSGQIVAIAVWGLTERSLTRPGDGRTAVELWNPIFDAIAEKRFDLDDRRAYQALTQLSDPFDGLPYPNPTRYLSAIASWAGKGPGAATIARVFRSFRADRMLGVIASTAPSIGPAEAKLLADASLLAVERLIENPHLTSETAAWVKDWALDLIFTIEGLAGSAHHAQLRDYPGLPGRILRNLQQEGHPLPLDDHVRLCDRLRQWKPNSAEVTSLSPWRQATYFYQLALSRLSHDVLEIVLPTFSGDPWITWRARHLLDDPNLPIEIVRLIVRHYNTPKTRALIAKNERWRTDPEIWPMLASSTAADIVPHTLRDADPDDFARIFRRVATKHPEIAAEVLEERMNDVAATLSRQDLLALLKAQDNSARLTAIQALPLTSPAPRSRRSSR